MSAEAEALEGVWLNFNWYFDGSNYVSVCVFGERKRERVYVCAVMFVHNIAVIVKVMCMKISIKYRCSYFVAVVAFFIKFKSPRENKSF